MSKIQGSSFVQPVSSTTLATDAKLKIISDCVSNNVLATNVDTSSLSTAAAQTTTNGHLSDIEGKLAPITWTTITPTDDIGVLAPAGNSTTSKIDLGALWNNKAPFLLITNSASQNLTIEIEGGFSSENFYEFDSSFINTASKIYSLNDVPLPRYFRVKVTNGGSSASTVSISVGGWGNITNVVE